MKTAPFCHSFEAHASRYEAYADIQSAAALALADSLAPERRRGRAVELGAGTGLLGRALAPWKGRYIALDAAPAMVALGKTRYPDAEWVCADARAFPMPTGTRWILSSSFFQWLETPQLLFARWRREAPQARMCCTLFVEGTLAELESVLPHCAPLVWRPPEWWADCLRSSGWRPEFWRTYARIEHTPTPADALKKIRETGAVSARPRVRAGALRAALKDYAARFSDAEGCRVSWRILQFEASPA